MNAQATDGGSKRVVITDTNILIILVIANDLSLLSRIPGLSFVVCPEVLSELLKADAQLAVQSAIDDGEIAALSIDTSAEPQTFADLLVMIGLGLTDVSNFRASFGNYDLASVNVAGGSREWLVNLTYVV